MVFHSLPLLPTPQLLLIYSSTRNETKLAKTIFHAKSFKSLSNFLRLFLLLFSKEGGGRRDGGKGGFWFVKEKNNKI